MFSTILRSELSDGHFNTFTLSFFKYTFLSLALDRIQTNRNKKYGLIKELSKQNKYETDKKTHRQYDVGKNVLIKIDLRNKLDNKYSGPIKLLINYMIVVIS